LKVRREVLRNPEAPDILAHLRWLIDNDIQFHTQIVVTPEVNDGAYLEQSVRDLVALWPGVESVSVVPVGLTKHHRYEKRTNTREEAEAVLNAVNRWQTAFRDEFGVNFVYPTDEWYLVTDRPIPPTGFYDGLDLTENGLGMVRRFMDDWEMVRNELTEQSVVSSMTLVTATLFAPTLEAYAAEFAELVGVKTEVVPVVNERLGETITVAGLLMGEDVMRQLQERELGDVLVLPRVMFDHPDGVSLDDHSPMDVATALGRPVALVDMMGDLVDIVQGRPALYFDPENAKLINPDAIQKDGGWAVEKYL
jgi:putative radical SAM enzyme (TIGR03279 family)